MTFTGVIMLNTIRTLGAFAVIGLVAGCGQSDNATSSSGNSQQSSDQPAVSRTSRDTNTSRVYTSDANNSANTKDADNTGKNVRDRSDAALTPGDQGNNDSDRQMTRQLRRALSTNDQFSTDAKNIKIITVNGKMTLRGPVKSAQEKQAVETAAQSVAGKGTVDDQLEVKASNQ